MDKSIWIPATIDTGLFPNERTASFETTDGDISVFVSPTQVDENQGRLKVVELDGNAEFVLIQVPSHGGSTVVKIPRVAPRRASGSR